MGSTTEKLSTDSETTKSGNSPPRAAKALIDLLGVLMALAICVWAAMHALQPGAVPSGSFATPKDITPCLMKTAGYLSGRLYGAIDMEIDWRGPKMDCDGMTRPDNNGIRLFFGASPSGDGNRLIFVLGIDGAIDELRGKEAKTNITIIDERTGSFFGTAGKDRCWTTIRSAELLPGRSRKLYQVDGDLYCAGALPSLTDNGSVTLGDFRYSGRLAIDDD
jgi:hypothetical protein